MRSRIYTAAPLCGFWGLSEDDFGDRRTPAPYPRVTPSRIGRVLLPFRCPHCGRACDEFSDAKEREKYRDPRPGRRHVWCPACRGRFYLNVEGRPLHRALPANAAAAPALIERTVGKKMIREESVGFFIPFIPILGGARYLLGMDALGAR